eukprot:RCo004913
MACRKPSRDGCRAALWFSVVALAAFVAVTTGSSSRIEDAASDLKYELCMRAYDMIVKEMEPDLLACGRRWTNITQNLTVTESIIEGVCEPYGPQIRVEHARTQIKGYCVAEDPKILEGARWSLTQDPTSKRYSLEPLSANAPSSAKLTGWQLEAVALSCTEMTIQLTERISEKVLNDLLFWIWSLPPPIASNATYGERRVYWHKRRLADMAIQKVKTKWCISFYEPIPAAVRNP